MEIMKKITTTLIIKIFTLSCLFVVTHAHANDQLSENPCAILNHFQGDVKVLNDKRSEIIEVSLNSTIPCGSWISVREGWAEFLDRQGRSYYIGSDTFVEVFNPAFEKQSAKKEHIVVYRGKMIIKSPSGVPAFIGSTANSLFEIENGMGLVSYNQGEEITQFVSLDSTAWIANRFVDGSKTKISRGEMSELNLKLLRVVPTDPSAVEIGSLRELLAGIPISDQDSKKIIRIAQARFDRKYAAHIAKKSKTPLNRSIASSDSDAYDVHEKLENEEKIKAKWLDHITGGEPGAEKILFLRNVSSKQGSVSVQNASRGISSVEDRERVKEKKRILDELSSIKAE